MDKEKEKRWNPRKLIRSKRFWAVVAGLSCFAFTGQGSLCAACMQILL
jgi:hypothetical protein